MPGPGKSLVFFDHDVVAVTAELEQSAATTDASFEAIPEDVSKCA